MYTSPMAIDPARAWESFGMFESATTIPAGRLVDHAAIAPDEVGLDVGCGTGVVAVTAASRGAKMSGIDPTVALLERAKDNAALAQVCVDWHEGGAESMPFQDEAFDVVLSQFGHMFAPNASAATEEMFRALKPGGRYVVAVWEAGHFVGQLWAAIANHGGEGLEAPMLWGAPAERKRMLAPRLSDYAETTAVLNAPCLSPAHTFLAMGRALAPMAILIDRLSSHPPTLERFRAEVLDLIEANATSNSIPQRYTIVSGKKL